MPNTDQLANLFTELSQTVTDTRAHQTRNVHTVYTFPGYTKAEWMAKAAELREHILVSNGLTPMPEKTPLNAHVFGRVEREDYSVEKVYFEAYPGFFTTGNLYRPKKKRTVSGNCQSPRTLGQRTLGEQRSRFGARSLYQLCQAGLRHLFL